MRKFIIAVAMATIVCFNVKAQVIPVTPNGNTTGNVGLGVSVDAQSRMITLRCNWSQNDSFIQPNFYWDTVQNQGIYRMHDTLGVKYFTEQGTATCFVTPYKACTDYYFKLEFTDGKTGQSYYIFNMIRTQGDQKPDVKKFEVSQVGFSFAQVSMNIDGHCNGFEFKLGYAETGQLTNTQYDENWGDLFSGSRSLYGMTPNKDYTIFLNVSNSFGDTTILIKIRTTSDLPPIIESSSANSNDTTSATCNAFIDPQNTTSTSFKIEYGKDINLGESTSWIDTYNKGGWGVGIGGLDPGTVYFWRAVAKNDFGHDEGQIKLFKTIGSTKTTGIVEITFNDLLHVSSTPLGILISAEKNTTAEIYSISGQKICTFECIGNKIIELNPGIYVVKAIIAGRMITKKVLIN